jgi:hypothetical protein
MNSLICETEFWVQAPVFQTKSGTRKDGRGRKK